MGKDILSISLSEIPFGSRLVVYGDGKVGELTIGKLRDLPGIEIVAVSDKYLTGYSFAARSEIINPTLLVNIDFDYIILAADSENVRAQMRDDLCGLNIQADKLRMLDWGDNEKNQIANAEYIKFLERNVKSEPVFWIFMVPEHGNIGDYAITVSTKKFLENAFPQYKILTVTTNEWDKASCDIKKLVKCNDIVFLNGGGYIGDLWDNTDRYRSIINAFSHNTVIMLPNTLTYKSEPTDENISFVQDIEWFCQNSNLHVLFRDKKSFECASKYGQNFGYFPDMVLKLSVANKNKKDNKKILLCLRNDREKVFDAKSEIIQELTSAGYMYDEFDINLKRYVNYNDAEELVKYACDKFQEYKCIITDRLHGMVLATISNVPCVAFDNSSHKVKGVYDWIKEYVMYSEDYNGNSIVDMVLNAIEKRKIAREYEPPKEEFTQLVKYIKKIIEM